jgi:hypothetical protein
MLLQSPEDLFKEKPWGMGRSFSPKRRRMLTGMFLQESTKEKGEYEEIGESLLPGGRKFCHKAQMWPKKK